MSEGSGSNQELKTLREWAEFIALVTRWGAVIVGGMSLLLYAGEIGHFPSGISLGEGLAFYLICAGFCLLYFIYWASLSSLGSLLMRVPFNWIVAWDRSRATGKVDASVIPHSVPLFHMNKPEVWITAVMGIWFLAGFSLNGGPKWYWLVPLALWQGFLVGACLIMRRRQDYYASGLGAAAVISDKSKREHRFALRVFVALLLFFPLVVMPGRQGFIDTAFRWAQLRKNNAVVHIKAPWTALVEQGGLPGQASFLGPQYKRYHGTTVLLRSLGDSVVLSIPTGLPDPKSVKPGTVIVIEAHQLKKIAIPATDIWIE